MPSTNRQEIANGGFVCLFYFFLTSRGICFFAKSSNDSQPCFYFWQIPFSSHLPPTALCGHSCAGGLSEELSQVHRALCFWLEEDANPHLGLSREFLFTTQVLANTTGCSQWSTQFTCVQSGIFTECLPGRSCSFRIKERGAQRLRHPSNSHSTELQIQPLRSKIYSGNHDIHAAS